MTRRTGLSLLLLALLALGVSSAAAVIHYHLLLDRTYHSACDINATWSCSQVYESQYGAFRGVPVAVGGVLWAASVTLLVVAGLALGRRAAEFAARVPGYIFALAVPGLSVVLYLAYASLFVLKTYCIFCLITYVAVAGIFLVSGAAADGSMTDLPRNARRDLKSLAGSPVGLLVSGLFVAGAVALVALFPRQVDATTAAAAAPAPLSTEQQTEFDRWYEALPRVPVAVPTDGAKVLIVKFNDYQCPPCRSDMGTVQAGHRQVPEHVSRQGEVRDEGLPARSRVQRERAAGHAPVVVRGRRGCQAGAGQGPGRGDGGVAVRQPAAADAGAGQAGGAQRGRGHRLRRPVPKRSSNW